MPMGALTPNVEYVRAEIKTDVTGEVKTLIKQLNT